MPRKGIVLAAAALLLVITALAGYRIASSGLEIDPLGGRMYLEATGYPIDDSRGGNLDLEWAQAETGPLEYPPATVQRVHLEAEPEPAMMKGSRPIAPDHGGNVRPGEASARTGRVVIHTARMEVVVQDVARTMEDILRMASTTGGWLVASRMEQGHSGHISIRIPANLLEQTMTAVRALAVETLTADISSQDVTDEYVDLTSRLTNEVNTREALEETLELTETPLEILEIRKLLHQTQESIEQIQGRLKLIQETVAFSLLSIDISKAPTAMQVDAGQDLATTTADPVSLAAVFQAPAGLDQFAATWNMGDGSPPIITQGTIPIDESNLRATATISHRFGSHLNSPYIVTVEVRGQGRAGHVLGHDQLRVTVIEDPNIQVNAGEQQQVYAGEEMTLSGFFTRPRTVRSARFQWDPGDGSDPLEGSLGPGETRATVKHTYRDPQGYRAKLTIFADTIAGEIARNAHTAIHVQEKPGYVAGSVDIGDAARKGVRGMTATLKGIAVIFLWTLIFIPIWAPAAATWWWVRRRRQRAAQGPGAGAQRAVETGRGEPTASGPETASGRTE